MGKPLCIHLGSYAISKTMMPHFAALSLSQSIPSIPRAKIALESAYLYVVDCMTIHRRDNAIAATAAPRQAKARESRAAPERHDHPEQRKIRRKPALLRQPDAWHFSAPCMRFRAPNTNVPPCL